jgi:hypothetical protein
MAQSNRALLWLGFVFFGVFAVSQGTQSNFINLQNHARQTRLEMETVRETNDALVDNQNEMRRKLLEVEGVRDAIHTEVIGLREVVLERDRLKAEVADLRLVVAERDQLLREVAALKVIAQDRDRLVVELKGRTAERDIFADRCDSMKKGIMNLMGADDQAHKEMLSAGLRGPKDSEDKPDFNDRGRFQIVPASRVREGKIR